MNPQTPQFQISTHPFKMNDNYDINAAGEAFTYNQIYGEITYLYGSDVVFMPRTTNDSEPIFGEYLASKIETGYPMRLLPEDVTSWNGGEDLYSKFGLQTQDTVTFNCPKLTFEQVYNITQLYPKAGDLIYYIKGKKLFEIQHVEDEIQPGFYVFGNRNSYQIKCKVYSYDHMEVATNSTIPAEVSLLNNLVLQDETNYNDEIIAAVVSQSILDNSEVDPITGR
jgi:hypothetical protein